MLVEEVVDAVPVGREGQIRREHPARDAVGGHLDVLVAVKIDRHLRTHGDDVGERQIVRVVELLLESRLLAAQRVAGEVRLIEPIVHYRNRHVRCAARQSQNYEDSENQRWVGEGFLDHEIPPGGPSGPLLRSFDLTGLVWREYVFQPTVGVIYSKLAENARCSSGLSRKLTETAAGVSKGGLPPWKERHEACGRGPKNRRKLR